MTRQRSGWLKLAGVVAGLIGLVFSLSGHYFPRR